MWRRLLLKVHPDQGGDAELFVWANALRGHVTAGEIPPPSGYRRTPPEDPPRVPFDPAAPFRALTARALATAVRVPEPHAGVLRLLAGCEGCVGTDRAVREQHQGATYKRLALIGHRVGMDRGERGRWYRIAESVPLSDRHAAYILSRLEGRVSAM